MLGVIKNGFTAVFDLFITDSPVNKYSNKLSIIVRGRGTIMSKILNKNLIDWIKNKNVLKSPRIEQAFLDVDRLDFVPEGFEDNAYLDVPIPISIDATTSQPSTIAFILELLNPEPGDKVLEIGTGSGYLTALLAEIVKDWGVISSMEIDPQLKVLAESNLKKYPYNNIRLISGDGKKGLISEGPFDKIVAGAEISEMPIAWKDQLTSEGTIVAPYNGRIIKAIKVPKAGFDHEEYAHFSFIKML
jgi:protein-L-isoaspartate(D-aspartate) O-methyltransferase